MTNDRRQLARDFVGALTERECADFIASAREPQATQGAVSRDFAADLFRPRQTGWDMSTMFNTTEETQA